MPWLVGQNYSFEVFRTRAPGSRFGDPARREKTRRRSPCAHAIDHTAAGVALTGGLACDAPADLAWTHTRATGSPFPADPCSGWLLGSGTAVAGLVHASNLGWTEGCPTRSAVADEWTIARRRIEA